MRHYFKHFISVVLVAFFIFLALGSSDDTETNEKDETTTNELSWYEKLPEKQKSKEMQEQRKEIIEKLINEQNIIYKTEIPTKLTHPRVYVTNKFYGLKFDNKKTFMEVVATYYFVKAKERGILHIRDAQSGKDIGTFDKYGLHMN